MDTATKTGIDAAKTTENLDTIMPMYNLQRMMLKIL